jgi:hypothetical protein
MRTSAPDVHAKVRARIHAQHREAARRALTWLGTFAAMVATDLCWVRYVIAANHRAPLEAGAWAVALFLLGALTVLGYTRDRWLLLPAAAGAFAGTYFGVILQ